MLHHLLDSQTVSVGTMNSPKFLQWSLSWDVRKVSEECLHTVCFGWWMQMPWRNPLPPLSDTENSGSIFLWSVGVQLCGLTSGTAVAQWLRCCATNRKVAGSIPDGVIGIFHWRNPSDCTMAQGSTQPLTEMSTRNISWGWKRPVHKADNLTTVLCRCHVIWEP